MAIEYDPEYGVLIDTDSLAVFDAETEEFLGYADEDTYDEADDPTAEEDDIEDVFQAAYSTAADEYRDAIMSLREEIAAARLEGERARGYEDAREEDQAEAEAYEESLADLNEDLTSLSTQLGRPLSTAEADRIYDLLPDNYEQSDIENAAAALNIRGFTDNSAPDGGGRGQRSRYLEERVREFDEAERDGRENGEPDFEDDGGMIARMQQATSLDY